MAYCHRVLTMFERLIRIRDHNRETPALFWSFMYFFLLLTAYYLLRPVRDAMGANANVDAVFPPAMSAWFAVRGIDLGDYTLQMLFLGTFISMVLLQPVYGWLVSRFPRRVFLPVVYIAFIASLFGFFLAFKQDMPGRGAIFFIWVAVFNLFAVSVFWSFMADIFSNSEAKSLYGYIGVGGTLGALTGPLLTKFLVLNLGIANMILISMGCLALCLACISQLSTWAKQAESKPAAFREEVLGGSLWQGLRLIASDPMMRLLALLMFFGVGVGTLLYNEQAAIAKKFFSDDASRTQFYSNIDLAINLLTLLVQVFLTKRILTRYGIAPALLIPAFAVMLGYAALAMSPLPLLVAAVQIATRAGEFSLAKPGRETIYTRVERQARYKAKAAIDTVVYRGGDLTFSWLHKGLSLFGSNTVFSAGLVIAGLMTISAWRVIQADKRLQSP
jgi:AAA family ATP:ADP antiporter